MIHHNLEQLRHEIDLLDIEIIKLLSQRMQLVHQVGVVKKRNAIKPLDAQRWQEVLISRLTMAKKLGLDQEMIRNIYENIHEGALKLEKHIQGESV